MKPFNALLSLAFCYLFGISLINGQVDSLTNVINSNAADSSKIDAYNLLSRNFLGSNPDTSIYFAEQASNLSRDNEDFSRLGTSMKNVGLGYYYKADFVRVLDYWQESLAAFEQANDSKGVSNLLSNIGAVYYSTGDNTKAIDYYLRSLRIAEESGEDFRVATVLQNIGAVYETTKEFDKAESYLIQALEICKVLEYDKGIGTVALNLGDIYIQQKTYDLAEVYLKMAKEYFEKTNDNYLATPITMLGKIQGEQGLYREALASLAEAKKIAADKGTKIDLVLAHNATGEIYLKTKSSSQAIDAFLKAFEIGKEIGVTEDLKETYEGLTKAYKLKGDFKSASRFQDSLINANITIYDNEKNNQVQNLQLQYDIEKQENYNIQLKANNQVMTEQIARAKLFRNFLMAIAALLVFVVGGIAYQYNYARKTNIIITEERNKSDKLLLNILPEETAHELKHNGVVKAQKYDTATVLFTDFVNFTGTAGNMPPEELVKTIDFYFKNFDEIIKKYDLEKIKTIGDAYMCAGGIPKPDDRNLHNALNAAAEIVAFVNKTYKNPPAGITPFQIRIGLNSGPLVAGVVGSSKFQYDIWGDTVNIASRMESNSLANEINVSESVYNTMKDHYNFEFRGELDVKNKGKMKMYFFKPEAMN